MINTKFKYPILSFSWIIETSYSFIKKIDKSILHHHGTGIPRDIRIFFGVEDIKVGEKRIITLSYKNNNYNAFIECDNKNRTRMLWYSDFANCIRSELPEWYDFFRNFKEYNETLPQMHFIKDGRNSFSVKLIDHAFTWNNGQPETIKEKEIETANLEKFWKNKYGRKIDYVNNQKINIELGFLGECYVIEYERNSLIKAQRYDLVEKIEHVSITRGDGLGFDVLSFNNDGQPKFIEVKTSTNDNKSFYITQKEFEFSKDYSGNFYLYRLLNFDWNKNKAKVSIVNGNLAKLLKLRPILYNAEFK